MGRKKEISDEKLFDGLVSVFQTYGYEGASMSRIAEATGLGRASLYHRFPGGKQEMALVALERANSVFGDYVLAPLTQPGAPATRLKKVAERMAEFYDDGRRSCLLDTLSMGCDPALSEPIHGALRTLKKEFAAITHEAGFPTAESKELAEQFMIELQGALVWARGSGDSKPFRRLMRGLPERLTSAGAGS